MGVCSHLELLSVAPVLLHQPLALVLVQVEMTNWHSARNAHQLRQKRGEGGREGERERGREGGREGEREGWILQQSELLTLNTDLAKSFTHFLS